MVSYQWLARRKCDKHGYSRRRRRRAENSVREATSYYESLLSGGNSGVAATAVPGGGRGVVINPSLPSLTAASVKSRAYLMPSWKG